MNARLLVSDTLKDAVPCDRWMDPSDIAHMHQLALDSVAYTKYTSATYKHSGVVSTKEWEYGRELNQV